MPVSRDLSAAKRAAILRWLTKPGDDGKPLLGTTGRNRPLIRRDCVPPERCAAPAARAGGGAARGGQVPPHRAARLRPADASRRRAQRGRRGEQRPRPGLGQPAAVQAQGQRPARAADMTRCATPAGRHRARARGDPALPVRAVLPLHTGPTRQRPGSSGPWWSRRCCTCTLAANILSAVGGRRSSTRRRCSPLSRTAAGHGGRRPDRRPGPVLRRPGQGYVHGHRAARVVPGLRRGARRGERAADDRPVLPADPTPWCRSARVPSPAGASPGGRRT